jgi:hypothetical protein
MLSPHKAVFYFVKNRLKSKKINTIRWWSSTSVRNAMNGHVDRGGVEEKLHFFLTLVLGGDGW